MDYAEALGCSIKLLGVSHVEDGKVSARVCPMMVPSGNPPSQR
jgi:homoserine dehydrogenase